MRNRRSPYKKGKNYLFVDGYNIINSWNNLIKLKNVSLEDARDELINIMIEFSHVTKEEIILVFDAYQVKKSAGKVYNEDGIKVVFTKEFETADHFIEKELDYIGRFTGVRVATSDNVEQQIILSRGGTRISARELEAEVLSQKIRTEKTLQKLKEERVYSLDEKSLDALENLKKSLGDR